jgi:DNA-binding NarL/FixJ family response regulator
MSTSTRVLVIDDHAIVRAGICAALEKREDFAIFQAATKSEALAQMAKLNPDVIVVDINLPDGSGLEIVSWARSISQTIAIVVLTLNEHDDFLLAAMKAGASSYLNKSAPLLEILAAIDHALAAPLTFSSRETVKTVERKRDRFDLSQRELQILTQLHKASPVAELASSLFITEATLKTHLSSIYRKLDVHSRLQAVEKARVAGLT